MYSDLCIDYLHVSNECECRKYVTTRLKITGMVVLWQTAVWSLICNYCCHTILPIYERLHQNLFWPWGTFANYVTLLGKGAWNLWQNRTLHKPFAVFFILDGEEKVKKPNFALRNLRTFSMKFFTGIILGINCFEAEIRQK